MTAKTITLAYPVTTAGGETISSVTLRRAKARDLAAFEAAQDLGQTEQGIAMIASLCDLPREVIEDLDGEDFVTVSEALVDFVPAPAAGPSNGAA